MLEPGAGPADVDPEARWLARKAIAVRLAADLTCHDGSERIDFSMEDPMSAVQANESHIDVVGCAELPITWTEPIANA